MEDDGRYPQRSYISNRHNSSNRRKIHTRDTPFSRPIIHNYEDGDDDELEDINEDSDEEYHLEEEEIDQPYGYNRNFEEYDEFEMHPKKRKLKNLLSGYEFVPKVKSFYGNRSLGPEQVWNDHAVFVLLEVWGDKFLQLGRKSLRSEDWHEVAEKVSHASKIERTEIQCRNILDTLKRKYKKEKMKLKERSLNSSKWAYYKKMDMLMASSPRRENGLACGVDSGEFVFMNTSVYLDSSNGLDEMRDSPVESEASEDENEDDSYRVMPRMMKSKEVGDDGSSIDVLADSIEKFGEIYENIENSKRQHVMELEKTRMNFHKELELQKQQMLEKAQAEIAKIQEEDEDEDIDMLLLTTLANNMSDYLSHYL